MRRVVRVLAALAAIYWAHCEFHGRPDGRGAEHFAGCFTGRINQPPDSGDSTIVVESSDPALHGCLRLFGGQAVQNGLFEGEVRDDPDRCGAIDCPEADVTVTPTIAGQPAYDIVVIRRPIGDVAAETLTLNNESGNPFGQAGSLMRCPTALTCQDLGITVPFLPDGGGAR